MPTQALQDSSFAHTALQNLLKPLPSTCSAALQYRLSRRPHLALDYDVPQVVYQRLGRPLSPVIIPAVQEVGW